MIMAMFLTSDHLSLEEMAFRRMAVNFWMEKEILTAIENFRYTHRPLHVMRRIWSDTVEDKVQSKISNCGLPKKMKKHIMTLVKPIGADILKWKIFSEYYIYCTGNYLTSQVLEQLEWTCKGSIDYIKTAEKQVHNETLDVVKRYIMACFYCLVNDIRRLWAVLPARTRLSFIDQNPDLIQDMKLEYYWPYILMDRERELLLRMSAVIDGPFHMWAYQAFACIGNEWAVKYFYQKLDRCERPTCIFEAAKTIIGGHELYLTSEYTVTFPHARQNEILNYILPKLSPEAWKYLLENHPRAVLSCFLEWPWHDRFLSLVTDWMFPNTRMYVPLLDVIRNPGFYSYFPNLFQELFLSSPSDFRKKFVDYECQYCRYFSNFFLAGDTESIEVVFRNIDHEDRMRFISSHEFFQAVLNILTERKRWPLAELCFREATASKEDREQVKNVFKGFLTNNGARETLYARGILKRISASLNKLNRESVQAKRSSEDEVQSVAKKSCQ